MNIMKRKSWRRALSLMLTAALTGGLCACGGSGDAESQPLTDSAAAPQTQAPETVTVTETDGAEGYDFIIDIPGGRDITILQLSDLQTMEMDGVRNDNRYHRQRLFHRQCP